MVASRRSAVICTSGTVIRWPSITGSCTSPRASMSASAWRTSSPTRSWRCEGVLVRAVSCWRRRAMTVLNFLMPGLTGHPSFGEEGRARPVRAKRGLRAGDWNSQRALHRLHSIAFDDVADLHVLVVLEGHAAFLAGDHLARVVLEAFELGELAFVHDDAVADQAHIGPALDHAVGHAAARHVADLGDLENLQDGRVAERGLAHPRREQAGHRLLHVVHEVVDDVVVADLDAGMLGRLARLLVGAHVEADDRDARSLRQRHVGFGDAAHAGMDHARADLLGGELLDR